MVKEFMPVEREEIARNKIPEPELWKSYDAAVRGTSVAFSQRPSSPPPYSRPQTIPSTSAAPRPEPQPQPAGPQDAAAQNAKLAANTYPNDPMQSVWGFLAPSKQPIQANAGPATPSRPASPPPSARPQPDRALLYSAIRATAAQASPANQQGQNSTTTTVRNVPPSASAAPTSFQQGQNSTTTTVRNVPPSASAAPTMWPAAAAAPPPPPPVSPDRRKLYESIRQIARQSPVPANAYPARPPAPASSSAAPPAPPARRDYAPGNRMPPLPEPARRGAAGGTYVPMPPSAAFNVACV
jgi:hypothetical protein